MEVMGRFAYGGAGSMRDRKYEYIIAMIVRLHTAMDVTERMKILGR